MYHSSGVLKCPIHEYLYWSQIWNAVLIISYKYYVRAIIIFQLIFMRAIG